MIPSSQLQPSHKIIDLADIRAMQYAVLNQFQGYNAHLLLDVVVVSGNLSSCAVEAL